MSKLWGKWQESFKCIFQKFLFQFIKSFCYQQFKKFWWNFAKFSAKWCEYLEAEKCLSHFRKIVVISFPTQLQIFPRRLHPIRFLSDIPTPFKPKLKESGHKWSNEKEKKQDSEPSGFNNRFQLSHIPIFDSCLEC